MEPTQFGLYFIFCLVQIANILRTIFNVGSTNLSLLTEYLWNIASGDKANDQVLLLILS